MNQQDVRERLESAAARRMHDARDAAAFIDLDVLVDDRGRPDERLIRAAIDQLLRDRPYLARRPGLNYGTGEHGARTTPHRSDEERTKRIAAYVKARTGIS